MFIEEYGENNESIIVMLHGAFFVHSFGRQYVLSEKYHLIVPHIMGYGSHTEKVFQTEEAITELAEYISGIGKQVTLIGFSLGAQLAYELICRHSDLFNKAIIVSPWLLKTDAEMPMMLAMNEKQLITMKDKTKCKMIALMNGLPRAKRTEFVNQMQKVSVETVRNSVNNGIELDDRFRLVQIPVIALAGEKEQKSVVESVKMMASKNANCTYQIWAKASHNIPPVFAKRFNKLIGEVMSEG